MTEQDDKKKGGFIGRMFEELSRPLGYVMMGVLIYIQWFTGIVVHDMAWISAFTLIAGDSAAKLVDRAIEKVTKK